MMDFSRSAKMPPAAVDSSDLHNLIFEAQEVMVVSYEAGDETVIIVPGVEDIIPDVPTMLGIDVDLQDRENSSIIFVMCSDDETRIERIRVSLDDEETVEALTYAARVLRSICFAPSMVDKADNQVWQYDLPETVCDAVSRALDLWFVR